MSEFICPFSRKNKVHVSVILDRSGSMCSCWDDTIGGFNSYLEGLKKDKETEYFISLTQFDDQYEINYVKKPLHEVGNLDRITYIPRGRTALLDAVGRTINTLGTVPYNEKMLMLIITDGQENASREFSYDQVKKLIADKTELGNWTFTYIGAVADAWGQGQSLGLNAGNTAKYDVSKTKYAFAMTCSGTARLAKLCAMNTTNFYGDSFTDYTVVGN